jgi:hypothetical protein
MTASTPYPCPACGFLVFTEPPGSYDVCAVCGWEDDGIQLEAPGYTGGANGLSLEAYQREHALPQAPLGVDVQGGYRRESGWRPVTRAEARPDLPVQRLAYDDPHVYYWRRSSRAI